MPFPGTTTMCTSPLYQRFAFFLALLLAQVAGPVACSAKDKPVAQTSQVAMSDGVKLATDVYLPAAGKAPYPAILVRTPYGKSVGQGMAGNLCPLGYALVVQDMRGRFASEGQPAI